MRKSLSLILVASALGLPTVGQAQVSLLLGGGYFQPTNSLIRGIFGSQWKIDPSVGSMSVSSDWKLKPDISIVSAHRDGNEFTEIPVSLALEKGFSPEDSSFIPYLKLGVGPSYVDYSFDTGGSHYANKLISWGGSVEAGVILGGKFSLSAKYNAFAKANSFDFSGTTLSAEYSVYSF